MKKRWAMGLLCCLLLFQNIYFFNLAGQLRIQIFQNTHKLFLNYF